MILEKNTYIYMIRRIEPPDNPLLPPSDGEGPGEGGA